MNLEIIPLFIGVNNPYFVILLTKYGIAVNIMRRKSCTIVYVETIKILIFMKNKK